ncbi:murein DD-endopeptidase MepM/ murein hydrolase activator NlpD [Mesorhizobium soli]|uniref:M23 family metallopeptidase n=1 Tax=Pseudaminobacter soli (ex Li et al. 2025) TaxID=1295366 RepID=UPI0024735422|nr:M23 family metallopeptidase [Mesorhizobium soli]MDH6229713.1 murein DD-endopeptidase MepM/ murein hydrolase activator NlpD [Mesorhizobium soli]
MRFSILAKNERILVRGAAVFLVAGMAAGCSSGVARFGGGGIDDVFTASTPNQRQIIGQNQPYPGDTQVAPLASAETAPVTRSTLTPVSSQPLPPPVSPGQSAPMASNTMQPVPVTSHVDQTVAGSAKPLAPAHDTKVAEAKPMAGATGNQPGKKAPGLGAPEGTLGVLPQSQQPKAGENAQLASAANSAKGAAAAGTYKVQQGDTLTKIAKRNGVSAEALKAANGMNDGTVRIGQTLRIPAAGAPAATTTVAAAAPTRDPVVTSSAPAKPENSDASKMASYTPPKKSDKVIEQAEEVAAIAPDSTGIGKMRWPVRGRVISAYGKGGGKANDGIDIQVPEGTSVKAAENGVVIYAGDGLKEFGNTVLVRHENGLVTVYGHASELKVTRGEKVKRGQELALSGMSGSTDTPRLHFEVRKNSTPVNPSGYLE